MPGLAKSRKPAMFFGLPFGTTMTGLSDATTHALSQNPFRWSVARNGSWQTYMSPDLVCSIRIMSSPESPLSISIFRPVFAVYSFINASMAGRMVPPTRTRSGGALSAAAFAGAACVAGGLSPRAGSSKGRRHMQRRARRPIRFMVGLILSVFARPDHRTEVTLCQDRSSPRRA